jgi:hypothetical protein
MCREEIGRAATLEELAPLGRHGVRVLEVLVEQEVGVAGVEAVDVACSHRTDQ